MKTIEIEVAYATPVHQWLQTLQVPAGTTARQAASLGAQAAGFAIADLAMASLGIFGKALVDPDNYRVGANDRVEIYRPLVQDPKAGRKARVGRAKKRPAKRC